MGVMIAFTTIGVFGIGFLVRFLFAMEREARGTDVAPQTAGSHEVLPGTYVQLVPISLDRRRRGRGAILGIGRHAEILDIEPAHLARLLHYYGEKVADEGKRSHRDWDHISETEQDRKIAAAALTLMDLKARREEESLTDSAAAGRSNRS